MKKILLMMLFSFPLCASSPKSSLAVPVMNRQYSREKLLEIRKLVVSNPVLVEATKEQLRIKLPDELVSAQESKSPVGNVVSPIAQSTPK